MAKKSMKTKKSKGEDMLIMLVLAGVALAIMIPRYQSPAP